MKVQCVLALFWLIHIGFNTAEAQIFLDNASFEGEPADATTPVGWHRCEPLTTPDILPGIWGVYAEPSDGETYVGLITRENGSFESIGQRLKNPIKADDCYQFQLDLAHSNTYSGFREPIKLRVWGGSIKCQRNQLLLETDFIEHTDWKTYPILFFAEKTINYLIFEAFYKEDPTPRKGNILIDNISFLKKCDRADIPPSFTLLDKSIINFN